MSIFDEVTKRIEELIEEGERWARTPHRGSENVTQGRGAYLDEIKSLTTHRDLAVGVPKLCVEMGVGILRALATSLTIEPDDFDCAQFSQRDSFV